MFPAHIQKEAASYARQYEEELRQRVIPFWEKYSIDREAGGYFTCLTREGKVFDTDKFMWLQGRQAWTFSMLIIGLKKNRNGWNYLRMVFNFLKNMEGIRRGTGISP